MTRLGASTACCLLMALAPAFAAAATFEVGPGQPLAGLNEVPWESLGPGDTVLLHWRSTPYKEKFVLCRQGTEAQPIVVRGVRGPGGERPIIDGDGATTRAALNFWNEDRGVIKIGGANAPADTMPRWIVLEGLDVTSGRPPFSFTGRNGLTDYAKNAAALYVEKGENITIRDCVIRDSGNGLFCGSQTRDLLVEGNELRDNGIEGSFYEHNNYTAAVGITFQFNLFRPLRTGCGGNNLKD
ncbi:MAG: right-handed parallel beta-helix repeat-containing protein, partial [Deltaproteobacteria bacterium]|nr:right-handed parallel beta-helix repeat-containing protein [Deltaproteobacteria bacterium]